MLEEPNDNLLTADADYDAADPLGDLDPDFHRLEPARAKPSSSRPAKSTFVETYKVELESPTLRAMWEQPNHHEAAAQLYRSRIGLGPLLEAVRDDEALMLVTFLYLGDKDTRTVILSGGPTDFEEPMSRFGRTHLWFHSASAPISSRFAYTFEEEAFDSTRGTEAIVKVVDLTDELNPYLASNGCSVLVLPSAEPLPSGARDRPALPEYEIVSKALRGTRRYALYTPPESQNQNLGLAVFFDGEAFATGWPCQEIGPFVDMPAILDHLINEGRIPPIFAVFVHVGDMRNLDLTGNPRYADFIALELIPAVRHAYPRVSIESEKMIVAGSSLGALCAAFCATSHPTTIGNVLSVSGSFWFGTEHPSRLDRLFGEGLVQTALMQSPALPIRFYLDVGKYEGQSVIVLPNRHVRDILLAKGYRVTYRESPSNHDYMRWHISMADGLVSLTKHWT